MGYIVQSIVFDKDKGWDMKTAREWVKNHKEFSKPIKEEETVNTIRVRLFPPKKAEQMGFKDYRMKTLASGDVGIMLDIAYNKMDGSGTGSSKVAVTDEGDETESDRQKNQAYEENKRLFKEGNQLDEILFDIKNQLKTRMVLRKKVLLKAEREKIIARLEEIGNKMAENQRILIGGMMNEDDEPNVAGVYRVDRRGDYLIQRPYIPTGRRPYIPRGNLTENEDIPLVEASPTSSSYQRVNEVPAVSGNNFRLLQRFLEDRNARQNFHAYDDYQLYNQISDLLRNTGFFKVRAKPFTKKQEKEYEELFELDHLPQEDRTPQTKTRILELTHKLMHGSARGGSLATEDLEALLSKSYHSKNPEDYKDFKVDKELSGQRVQVYHNPITQQTVVAHRGTASIPNWIENVAYAVSNDKSGKAFQHSKKIQDQAYAKYGKEHITTIGHSKGALHAQEYGKEGKEVITLNKPVNITDALFTRVPKSQTDIRTQYDPVSFLRPFQRGSKVETIKSTTKNPLKEHQTSVLGRLDPRKLFGSSMMCDCCGVNCNCGAIRAGRRKDMSKMGAVEEGEELEGEMDEDDLINERALLIANQLDANPNMVFITGQELIRARNNIRNSYREALVNSKTSGKANQIVSGLQQVYTLEFQESLMTPQLLIGWIQQVASDPNIPNNEVVVEFIRIVRDYILTKMVEAIRERQSYWENYLGLNNRKRDDDDDNPPPPPPIEGNGKRMKGGVLLPTISGQPPTVDFRIGNKRQFYFSVIEWVISNNNNLRAEYLILQSTSRGKTLLKRNIDSTIGEIDMNEVRNIINGGDEDEIIELLLEWSDSVQSDINGAIDELQQDASDSGYSSASDFSVGAGMNGGEIIRIGDGEFDIDTSNTKAFFDDVFRVLVDQIDEFNDLYEEILNHRNLPLEGGRTPVQLLYQYRREVTRDPELIRDLQNEFLDKEEIAKHIGQGILIEMEDISNKIEYYYSEANKENRPPTPPTPPNPFLEGLGKKAKKSAKSKK